MLPKAKIEVLSPVPRRSDPAAFDAFHENRMREDLAEFSEAPGLLDRKRQANPPRNPRADVMNSGDEQTRRKATTTES